MIFFSITVIISTFIGKYDSLIKEFEITSKSKEALVKEYIGLSSNFIDLMTVYGNDFFLQGESYDSELFSLLEYNHGLNNYTLDAVGGTKHEKNAGNLTGIGSVPKGGINKSEVNLAMRL